MDNIEKEYTQG